MLMFLSISGAAKTESARRGKPDSQRSANEAVVYFVKALLHRLDGEYRRALRSYDRLVRLDPLHTLLRVIVGHLSTVQRGTTFTDAGVAQAAGTM